MGPTRAFDVYSPAEIARHVESVCVAKAATPLLSLVMFGILAGAFIGVGSLFYVIGVSDPSLGFAATRVLGGAVFSLGLLLVVVAGAELFTGNNLLAMAWAHGSLTTRDVLHNRFRRSDGPRRLDGPSRRASRAITPNHASPGGIFDRAQASTSRRAARAAAASPA
jgi:hypothetical protein